jgi:hypothetical protein
MYVRPGIELNVRAEITFSLIWVGGEGSIGQLIFQANSWQLPNLAHDYSQFLNIC